MRGLRRSPQLVAAVVAAVLLLLPGVAAREWLLDRQERTRVNVRSFPLDLVYGASPPPDASPQDVVAAVAPLLVGQFEFPEIDLSFTPRPSVASDDPCPPPGPDVFPEEPAGLDVDRPVAAGVYRFRQEGTLEIVGLAKTPLAGFTDRSVRDVVTGDGGGFSYDMSATAALRRQVTAFEVVPGDGAFLARVETKARDPQTGEERTRVFDPVTPVEVFPLPVAVGQPFTSIGFDPTTLEVLSVEGRVTEKQRVEGCNEIVDGWRVDASWTFQQPGSAPVVWDYDYTVAPQHGGFVVADRLRTTEFIGPLTVVIDVTSTFGSLDPRPEGRAS